jgi:hypothetical protein
VRGSVFLRKVFFKKKMTLKAKKDDACVAALPRAASRSCVVGSLDTAHVRKYMYGSIGSGIQQQCCVAE